MRESSPGARRPPTDGVNPEGQEETGGIYIYYKMLSALSLMVMETARCLVTVSF